MRALLSGRRDGELETFARVNSCNFSSYLKFACLFGKAGYRHRSD
ncbi:hypothetical protein USDA257_p05610 (plasmid) [Sinorhizobium fredii USDA 257]|uniref:Uncharacterized protein n=1 Tax=Sinorhizobium fredii (strain USDA 257) TaxID=1185652 RepID=I3XHC0_SINF2|nr:hypothetical protein USDA257_p05610 [Sinorhizobium fredii USDA 257]